MGNDKYVLVRRTVHYSKAKSFPLPDPDGAKPTKSIRRHDTCKNRNPRTYDFRGFEQFPRQPIRVQVKNDFPHVIQEKTGA